MTQFCTKCGTQKDLNANFCEQCGAPFRPPVAVVKRNRSMPEAPRNLRRVMLSIFGIVGLAFVGVSAWNYLSPNRPSENTFTKVLNAYYANNKVASENLYCLTNMQYGRNPIYANSFDFEMKEWMNVLVSAGLYTGPEQVSTRSGYFVRQQFKYDRTELGNKAVHDGKLCFADGVKVNKVVSFTDPHKVDGHDATVVTYMIELVNQAQWFMRPEIHEEVKDKLGTSGLEKQASLSLGDKGWEWAGEGHRLGSMGWASGATAQRGSSSGGFFASISDWFGGLFSSDPDAVVKEFYRNIEHGNVDAAIAGMSQGYLSVLGPQKLRQMIEGERERVAAQGGIDSIQTEIKIEGDQARVRAVIKYKNGIEKKENSLLVKENGKWKIGG